MKTIFIAVAALSVVFFADSYFGLIAGNYNTPETPRVLEDTFDPAPGKFKAALKTNPGEIRAGEQAELSFTVTNEKDEVVKDLSIVHEKPMHLLIVSEDLAEYYHIHPEPQTDGTYRVPFTFPNGGNFKLYADFTPKDSTQVVETFSLKVTGKERARVELKADEKFEKTLDGLRFVMKPDADLVAGKELMLTFSVFDEETNKPVSDLEKYLGEYAHFVIISQDLQNFVHAHPMSKEVHTMGSSDMSKMNGATTKTDESKPHTHAEKSAVSDLKMPSPSEVSAHTSFPKAGLFKVFAQFQRAGKVITVPFVVNIKAAPESTDMKSGTIPAGAIKITVSENGYEPATISAKKGQKTTIAFYRADADNCGGEVVFPKLKITKRLPVGKTVLVEIIPAEDGELSFSCGMGMMKGKVLVQ